MKKVLAVVLLLALSLTALLSCEKKNKYEDVTYREDGLYFVLPNTMRRKDASDYEFYFSNELLNLIFMAKKITNEVLADMEIDPGVTAKEYVDIIMERRDFDKSKIYYTYDEERNHYNFRYSYDDEENLASFFYVTVTGSSDNLWYIEMCCTEEESAEYLPTFENWRKSIGTYS